MMNFITEIKTYILFLPSVFISDCDNLEIDEILSQSGIDKEFDFVSTDLDGEDGIETIDYCGVKKYESVPEYFINAQKWIQRINLLCCLCHRSFDSIPIPIALNKCKILAPEIENEKIISFPKKKREIIDEDNKNDDNILYSFQTTNEISVYLLHKIISCSVTCAINYIRKIPDEKITNKKESIIMTLNIFEQITGEKLLDVPDMELWIIMKQYCGESGLSRKVYSEKQKKTIIKKIN